MSDILHAPSRFIKSSGTADGKLIRSISLANKQNYDGICWKREVLPFSNSQNNQCKTRCINVSRNSIPEGKENDCIVLLRQQNSRVKSAPVHASEHNEISTFFKSDSTSKEWGNNPSGEKSAKRRPDLVGILNQIKLNGLPAGTPILTNVVQQKNLLRVIIPNVRELQHFAEEMKGNKTFQLLKTRPIRVELMGRDVKRLSREKTVELEKSEQREIEKRIEADVVLKVFLNGCDYATDQFVSVCLSVVNRNEEEQKQDVRQNIPEEEWLIVSVYLKHPNTDENAYRKDFKMKFSPQLEKGGKGLVKFIDKKELSKYISPVDGSVTIGVSILIESLD
ncbi:uncharacterized protein LOC142337119 [Convolutriloba macropyga]|uniref:uncharacterized protein LOC142337119 n=1 Tax=Convolutriloba macropyga TaxID=536237 RepID=UPI003F5204AF